MKPEEITNESGDDEVFAGLLKRANSSPPLAPLPLGLSEKIAAATYARPTLWDKLALVLSPAPARFALGGAVTAAVLSAVLLPRFSRLEPVKMNPSPMVIVAEPRPPAPKASEGTSERTMGNAPRPNVSAPVSTKTPAGAVAKSQADKRAVAPLAGRPLPDPRLVHAAPSSSTLADRARVALAPSTPTSSTHVAAAIPEPSAQSGQVIVAAATRSNTESQSELLPTPSPTVTRPAALVAHPSHGEVALVNSDEEERHSVNLTVTNAQMKAAQGGYQTLSASGSGYKPTGNQLSVVSGPIQ